MSVEEKSVTPRIASFSTRSTDTARRKFRSPGETKIPASQLILWHQTIGPFTRRKDLRGAHELEESGKGLLTLPLSFQSLRYVHCNSSLETPQYDTNQSLITRRLVVLPITLGSLEKRLRTRTRETNEHINPDAATSFV